MPDVRTILLHCGICGQWAQGPQGMHSCMDCLRAIGREVCSPDCASKVYLLITDDELRIDVRHDPTCPAWLAYCADNDNPDQLDVVEWTIRPQQQGQ